MFGINIFNRHSLWGNPVLLLITALTTAAFTCQGGGANDFEVIRRFPHDTTAYTQGLLYVDGQLYESTGQLGRSDVRRVDLETGQVQASTRLANDRFGEGLALLGDKLFQLTWQTHVGYVYEASTLALVDSFAYEGEGWGLATDGTSLIMSDGTANLRYLDPETFETTKEVTVEDNGSALTSLNELEWVNGALYANIYQSDRMVRIDPNTGAVQAWFNLRGLLPDEARTRSTDVLNGIAFHEGTGNLLVTGKFWPALFEIRLRN
jgi:glutaminyl-peptide cyclotransferase